jgi:hypothetical protein
VVTACNIPGGGPYQSNQIKSTNALVTPKGTVSIFPFSHLSVRHARVVAELRKAHPNRLHVQYMQIGLDSGPFAWIFQGFFPHAKDRKTVSVLTSLFRTPPAALLHFNRQNCPAQAENRFCRSQ